jgi:hypothetical protein
MKLPNIIVVMYMMPLQKIQLSSKISKVYVSNHALARTRMAPSGDGNKGRIILAF